MFSNQERINLLQFSKLLLIASGLLGILLYHLFFNNYIIINSTQHPDGRVRIEELRLAKGGYFSIQAANADGSPSRYTFFNSVYLSPGTYTDLKIRLASEVHLAIDPEELRDLPLKLAELQKNIYKYTPEGEDEFYVVLYEPPKETPVKVEETLRTDFDTKPIKNFIRKPIWKHFKL